MICAAANNSTASSTRSAAGNSRNTDTNSARMSIKGNTRAILKTAIGSAVILALTGCDSIKFIQYSGLQATWPTAPAAFVNTARGIPIYHDSFPPRPYIILGRSIGEDQDDGDFAQHAKRYKADAVIITGEDLITTHVPGVSLHGRGMTWTSPTAKSTTVTHAYLIRFTSNEIPISP